MNTFLLDLWNDLRAKRLWPVAVLLLVAVVATPVVLSKKAEEPDAAPVPQPAAQPGQSESDGPAALAEVKLEELAEGSGSSLSAFKDPANPFAPPRKVMEAAQGASGPASGELVTGGSPVPVDGGSSPGGSIGGDVNFNFGDTGSGGSDGPGGDTGGDTAPDTGGDTGETQTTSYTYVIDITFRENGRARRIKDFEKLDMLPGPASPLLIFLGVSANAGNAVFLVDSSLDTAGEGSCRPSDADCAFLYLGPGSEHEFTNAEGDSYSLRVDEIRRVRLDRKASASKRKAKGANAAVGRPTATRRFVPPLLAELVTVSSGAGDKSTNDTERR
jgi:hypothetical protein